MHSFDPINTVDKDRLSSAGDCREEAFVDYLYYSSRVYGVAPNVLILLVTLGHLSRLYSLFK
jgi:hypothetical protein